MNKKLVSSMILIVIVSLIAGCGTTAKFVYPSNMNNLVKVSSEPLHNKSVAVLPFEDYRSDNNSSAPVWLYLIPLSPYGWMEYDRPDAARMFFSVDEFQMNVSEDLAKATAVSLKRSNIFKDAYFTFGGEKENADFDLQGQVNMLYYKGRIISYGLSAYGPMLWFFGLPGGTSLNKIDITLFLRKKGSSKIIWEYNINKEDYYTQSLYYKMGWDTRLFVKLYEEGMNEALNNLAKTLSKNPKLLE